MGYAQGFDFAEVHEIFNEHVRLTAFGNHLAQPEGAAAAPRVLDLGGLAGLSRVGYDALTPVQWPIAAPGQGTARLFTDGCYAHPDGRARFIATAARAPLHAPDPEYPLILNTGRVRDQWHTMTRTGKSPRLSGHTPEPFIDMHRADALRCGVRAGELARVHSRWGALVARVQHGGGVLAGNVFVPIHWNDQFASDARVGGVVNPAVDPISGEPEFKHTPVRVEPFAVRWYGFALSRQPLAADALTYWTSIQGEQFVRYEVAGHQRLDDRSAWARAWLGAGDADADWLEYEDRSAGVYRGAHVVGERIEACVFLSPRPELPARSWLAGLFAQEHLPDIDRVGLLVGELSGPGIDTGPMVCSCFGVGRNTLCEAIRTQGFEHPAQITASLRAGGNCGSCVPELRQLIAEVRAAATA